MDNFRDRVKDAKREKKKFPEILPVNPTINQINAALDLYANEDMVREIEEEGGELNG